MDCWAFEAIGTHWEISAEAALDAATRAAVSALVSGYDQALSRFRSDSILAGLVHGGGTASLPGYTAELFSLFDALDRLTEGRMNPLVGGSLELLGYGPGYRLTPQGPAAGAPPWRRAVQWEAVQREPVQREAEQREAAGAGEVRLSLDRPATIDVGAAGKGQLVDLVWELVTGRGYASVVVDAGSDMRHCGPGLRIGLEHPFDPSRAIGVVQLQDRALCASASNRRTWGDGLHHVLDASTGLPVQAVAATWVLARDAMTADGLATALFLTDPSSLAAEFDFDYVRMFSDGRAEYSSAMAGVLYS
ncbi:FAD:protein FMN transferase [Arthrobacter gandavensis]|uniref:FAD:protein FMN transferase n=1 Tax=Arthrobacter gandavensis TaxID=169960 RepID=UPI00188E74F3|nr:FAD:protein FMN transferase [Arthrobacter gandavensis]MBF4993586.1 FAD:protein FMN transferase [Arthrobacter gandavensis]